MRERINKKAAILMSMLMFVFAFVLITGTNANAEMYSTISGHVVEDGTGNPVVGQTVEAVSEAHVLSALTDAKGFYVIHGVTSGVYSVYLEDLHKSNYYSNESPKEVTVLSGKNIVNNNYTVKETGFISGKIFKDDGVTPCEGAVVHAMPSAGGSSLLYARTDENGFYRIGGLPDDEDLMISVGVPSIARKRIKGIKIVGGEETKGIDVVFIKNASTLSIKGRILSKSSKEPIENAEITLLGDNGAIVEAITDENGNFELFGLLPDRFDLTIDAVDYEYFNVEFELKQVEIPLEIDFELIPKNIDTSSPAQPPSTSFFSRISEVLKLNSTHDFSLVSEAHAQDSSCWKEVPECSEAACCIPRICKIVKKWKKNLKKYPNDGPISVFRPYNEITVCVSKKLNLFCTMFNEPLKLASTMKCMQRDIIGKRHPNEILDPYTGEPISSCWSEAVKKCNNWYLKGIDPNHDLDVRAAENLCTTKHVKCEARVRTSCFKDSYGKEHPKDFYVSITLGVVPCVPTIIYDAVFK